MCLICWYSVLFVDCHNHATNAKNERANVLYLRYRDPLHKCLQFIDHKPRDECALQLIKLEMKHEVKRQILRELDILHKCISPVVIYNDAIMSIIL